MRGGAGCNAGAASFCSSASVCLLSYQRKKDSAGDAISLSSYNNNLFVKHQIDKLKVVGFFT